MGKSYLTVEITWRNRRSTSMGWDNGEDFLTPGIRKDIPEDELVEHVTEILEQEEKISGATIILWRIV